MKKILCVLALCLAFCGGVFAQNDSASKSSVEYELKRPVRIELGWVPLLGLDVKGAYMFRINDVLRWDVGVDMKFMDPGLIMSLIQSGVIFGTDTEIGFSFDVLAMADFWFWDFYTSYGLGMGINTVGGAAFIPFDWRIGWEPGSRKNNRVQFKLEMGLFGTTYGAKVYDYYNRSSTGLMRTELRYIVTPKLNIGVAVRF